MEHTVEQATEQDTETIIFGSGFDTYSWWTRPRRDWDYDEAGHAPNGWTWEVNAEDPHGSGHITKTVSHTTVMDAVRTIAEGGGGQYINAETRAECRNVLSNLNQADLDADAADQVMQVVMFGEVFYG